MKQNRTRELVLTALLVALVFVVTWTVRVPVPASAGGGYVNIGDSVINAGALLVGFPAALAAALGSALADFAAAAAVYIPATFVIKGLMGIVVVILARKRGFAGFAAGVVLAELLMLVGYAAFEYFTFDQHYALASLPFNVVQAVVNTALSLLLYAPVAHLRGVLDLTEKDRP